MNGFRSALQVSWRALRLFHPRFFVAGKTLPCLLIGLVLGVATHAEFCRRELAADIVIVNGNEPESLDPALIVTGISEMRITKALFEGLLRLDPVNARPVPGLAESWEVSPDKKIYTFVLRTNARSGPPADHALPARMCFTPGFARLLPKLRPIMPASFSISKTPKNITSVKSKTNPRSAFKLWTNAPSAWN